MKVLVIGASGMLGSSVFRQLSLRWPGEVFGTIRSSESLKFFRAHLHDNIKIGIDISDPYVLINLLNSLRPQVVVNCVGLVKQLKTSSSPLDAIPINALFPHKLHALCQLTNSRLIHISTDCVFNGEGGGYTESDISNASDLYGRTKFLGEVLGNNALTLRTSIIGHELQSNRSLVDWFLASKGPIRGFTKAIFSGLPTCILSDIIADCIECYTELSGLYHVSSHPISKYDLLSLINKVYNKNAIIHADDSLVIDRSLNCDRFTSATGVTIPEWDELVDRMWYDFKANV